MEKNSMKKTVVISTYNGEKYILEQLESILNQTTSPDEVIIYDDCSNDKTVELISSFIKKYSLKNWYIKVNESNLGWRMSFYNAILASTGDLIFLCDQDDIWNERKIEEMTKIMSNNSKISLLASNYTPFYMENGTKINLSSDEKKLDGSVCKISGLREFFYILRPGCTYCVRSTILPYFRKYFNPKDAHDALLWRLSFMLEGLYIYNSSTIFFRRHSTNATGKEKANLEKRRSDITYYLDLISRLEFFYSQECINNSEIKRKLDSFHSWANMRKTLMENGNFFTWLSLFKYRMNYYSFKTFLSDLLFLVLLKD